MTGDTGRTEIAFNRSRLAGTLLLLLPFVLICLYCLFNPPVLTLPVIGITSSWPVRLLSLVFVFVLVMGARSVIKQINSSEPALILDTDGITDHTTELSHGLIRWTDIIDIAQLEQHGLKTISLHVPVHIDHSKPKVKMARKNADMISDGTINIDTQNLELDSDSLFNLINDYYQKHNQQHDAAA